MVLFSDGYDYFELSNKDYCSYKNKNLSLPKVTHISFSWGIYYSPVSLSEEDFTNQGKR